jgi:hypothetical protein
MIKVYSDPTLAEVSNVKNVLERDGIRCILRNEYVSAPGAGLDIRESYPEVRILDDADEDRARALVAEIDRAPVPVGPPWRCPRCGEDVDAIFTRCWSCEAERG